MNSGAPEPCHDRPRLRGHPRNFHGQLLSRGTPDDALQTGAAHWSRPFRAKPGTCSFAEYVTSDHRVAGSSHAGCRSSLLKDFRAIMHFKNKNIKSAVIRLLSGFPVLHGSLVAHVRTTTGILAFALL